MYDFVIFFLFKRRKPYAGQIKVDRYFDINRTPVNRGEKLHFTREGLSIPIRTIP